jgi:hypothetical protein
MRSVSIALLEAIDQRLFDLVSRTNASYLGASSAEREALIEKHTFVYEITGKTEDDNEKLRGLLGPLETRGCVVFCFSKGVGELTVKGGSNDYPIVHCLSFASVMQLFSIECSNSKVNKVDISPNGRTISLNGQSIEF